MPKQKTHKGLKKRFKVTARGKVKCGHSYRSHLMRSKNAKRRRRTSGTIVVSKVFAKKLRDEING